MKFATTENGTTIGATRMRILDNGNVGIGTTTPTFALDVSGSSRIVAEGGADNPPFVVQSDSLSMIDVIGYGLEEASTHGGAIRFHGAAGSAASPLATPVNSIIGNITFRPHDGTTFLGSSANVLARTTENVTSSAKGAKLQFSTTETGTVTNTTRMTIADNGNVGIGTETPGGILHLVDEGSSSNLVVDTYSDVPFQRSVFWGRRARGTVDSPASILSGDEILSMTVAGYDGVDFSNQGNVMYFASEDWSSTNKGVYMQIEGTDTGSTTKEAWMTLKDSNVGIGTTAPAAKLDVNGEIKVGASTGLSCSASSEGSLRYNSASSCIEFCDSSTWTCITPSTCPDTTPDAFTIPDLNGQATSTQVSSSIQQINGLGCAVNVQAYGEGSPQLRICSDSACSTLIQDWTSGASSISSGQYLQLRTTTSATGGDPHTVTVNTGSVVTTWNATSTGDCTVSNPIPGTVCSDGSIYVGLSLVDGSKTYMTRCTYGESWNGSVCTGTPSLIKSTSGSHSSNLVNIGGSDIDGKDNSNSFLAATTSPAYPFPTVNACENLVESGKSDWYVPASQELLEANNIFDDLNISVNYWSSKGDNSYTMYLWQASTKSIQYAHVNNSSYLRCFRRD